MAPPTREQQQIIEDWGLLFEAHRMPPMVGRVLGRLHLCYPPEQSMAQLTEALGASKASISTTLGLLDRLGVVERRRQPGERQEYFRLHSGALTMHLQEQSRRLEMQLDLVQRSFAVADCRDAEGLDRLDLARSFLSFMSRELPQLLERWEASRTDPDRRET